jgi:excinuclease ABC subunit A
MSKTMATKKTVAKKKPTGEVIEILGARVNNLKNVSVTLPRNAFVVITGLSGSGKSSLAFDTLYAEANRRYMESLSSYARNFLDGLEKPDVDAIHNLSPAISIDQKSVSRSPRSTVGTMTEVYDYLRVLYAKYGVPHCPGCGKELHRKSARAILEELMALPENTYVTFAATSIQFVGKTTSEIVRLVETWGYVRVLLGSECLTVEEILRNPELQKSKDPISVVIDRLTHQPGDPDKERILDNIETAFHVGGGTFQILLDGKEERTYNNEYRCDACGIHMGELLPIHFSFNNPAGACETCSGLGRTLEFQEDLVVPNKDLTFEEGAVRPWSKMHADRSAHHGPVFELRAAAKRLKISLTTPVKKMKQKDVKTLLYGEVEGEFPGVIPLLQKKYQDTKSEHLRKEIEQYMMASVCPSCQGKRLQKAALSVRVAGVSLDMLTEQGLDGLNADLENIAVTLRESGQDMALVQPLLSEMTSRITAVVKVGLGYLSLSRSADTLSGGEAQRIRLAVQMKAGLSGIIYVLDEPSVGLHSRDTERLIAALKELQEGNNSLIIVEHDVAIMKTADYIVDMGPGAGSLGGEVIYAGTPEKLLKSDLLTGRYLSGKQKVSPKKDERKPGKKALVIEDATEHNLKNVTATFPLGLFVAVAGVSGSGKSSLVRDILVRSLSQHFYHAKKAPGAHKRITGLEHIDKIISVNQEPIGRTPRSNAATYTGVFGPIRDLFAATADASKAKYPASHFSFNMRGGRCETCQGGGVKKVEMYLLPDMYVPCETCQGTRYNEKTLAIQYRGVNISEVLEMSVRDARSFFLDQPAIEEKLRVLEEVGLGYLILGQSATSLSGGEAQRIKLATELARKSTGKTLYVLDEPTIGLHFEDVRRLLGVLEALVEKGNTVVVVEHNTDVIASADWVIELGLEGGARGGEIVFAGPPSKLKKDKKSLTAKYL